ncbi:MAG: hypothetical protein ACR2NN_04575 [Bryobacteraceae bacterium]
MSSAVKTPVTAVIEYNYERDGEIVIPAGTKAIGQLAQANQNGQVGLRFTTLEMPDGGIESIDGSGVSLEYGPLKGVVNHLQVRFSVDIGRVERNMAEPGAQQCSATTRRR